MIIKELLKLDQILFKNNIGDFFGNKFPIIDYYSNYYEFNDEPLFRMINIQFRKEFMDKDRCMLWKVMEDNQFIHLYSLTLKVNFESQIPPQVILIWDKHTEQNERWKFSSAYYFLINIKDIGNMSSLIKEFDKQLRFMIADELNEFKSYRLILKKLQELQLKYL